MKLKVPLFPGDVLRTLNSWGAEIRKKVFVSQDELDSFEVGLQQQTPWWGGTSVGPANVYQISVDPPLEDIEIGQKVSFIAHQANTSSCTLSVNGLPGFSIKSYVGGGVADPFIYANHLLECTFDGTYWQLTNDGLDPDLNAIAALSGTNGVLSKTAANTWALTAIAQGDLFYGSGTAALSALAKNTTATRCLTNTGTNNNPAWAQLDLTTGATAAETGWTPTLSVPTGSLSGTSIGHAKHIKIGRLVCISVSYTVTVASGTPAYISITNLPYSVGNYGSSQRVHSTIFNSGLAESGTAIVVDNSTEIRLYRAAFANYSTAAGAGAASNFFYIAAS